jgi:hypothetical protein
MFIENESHEMFVQKKKLELGLVSHAHNSSHSGSRDWEDHGLRSAWAKSETLTQK